MRGVYPPSRILRRGEARPLGELLGGLLRELEALRRRPNAAVARAWEEVVGAEVARHAQVVGFRGGIVRVDVDAAVWLHELGGFHKANLLKELQRRVKGVFVKDIRFRQGGRWSPRQGQNGV